MPASSYSSSVSWGVYLASSLLLIGAVLPALSGLRGYADDRACADVADGVLGEIQSLHQGLSVLLPLESLSPAVTVEMQGHVLRVTSGQAEAEREAALLLPNVSLSAGLNYILTLNGTSVEVFSAV